jgi:cytoskeleton protein RodZ
MSETAAESTDSRARAGAALRAARTAAGRSVEELAAQLKVAPAKIAALESGDWSALPDETFGRALLRSCCKALKVDPQPMLDMLPGAPVITAPQPAAAHEGFSGLPEQPLPRAGSAGRWSRGLLLLATLIALLAAVVYLWPTLHGRFEPLRAKGAAPAEHGASPERTKPTPSPRMPARATSVAPEREPVAAASTPAAVASAASAPAAASGAQSLQISVTAPSWVQVTARDGKVLVSKLLQPGALQTVEVSAASAPLSVVVGNAPGTSLRYGGKPIDLAPHTRGNVARLTLP